MMGGRLGVLTLGLLVLSPERVSSAPYPTRAYEPSSYELAVDIPRDARPWSASVLRQELANRIAREKRRTELDVYYYRIGHTMAYPLPVARRPTRADLPPGIETITYPWLIWLSWELEERWRVLQSAWRQHDDRDAGRLLQREMAALAEWENFLEVTDKVNLVTAHLAAGLSLALADTRGWESGMLQQARSAANALLERDVAPWLAAQWPDNIYTPARLHNIPVITLARAAQLARIVGNSHADVLNAKMKDVLRAWCGFRTGNERHTEGTAYDGYLFDSITEWLASLPPSEREGVLSEHRAGFRSLVDAWSDLTLPGRFDLHVPLGDVEAEMPFWANALARFAVWYRWDDAAWLLARFPAQRLPAAALALAEAQAAFFSAATTVPAIAPREHPHAVTLRTGWTSSDLLAAVSVSRNPMSHLHTDGGHVILAWNGRSWITDPGYQQYRRGEERLYTVGTQAHNSPVINGTAQKKKAARLLGFESDANGGQHMSVELADCYTVLPAGASVQRDIWLRGDAAMVVRDTFRGLSDQATIATHWLGGAHFAWAFVDGWARLSDGERALWIGTWPGAIAAASLTRHPGSRGPLTLAHSEQLPGGSGVRWWIFSRDPEGGWVPPRLSADNANVTVMPAEGNVWNISAPQQDSAVR